MSGLDTNIASLWQTYRDDDHDAYQITDASERVIASVPIGATKQELHRQQYVRDLMVAAPVLLETCKQVQHLLDKPEEPDRELCRALLARAIAAARGQL